MWVVNIGVVSVEDNNVKKIKEKSFNKLKFG